MKRFASLMAAAGGVAGAVALMAGAPVAGAAGSASSAVALPNLTVKLTGKSVTVGGSTVSGAVNVVSTTTDRDAEPTLVRLNPGATLEQGFAAIGRAHGDPNALAPYGSIVFDADAPHGTSSAQTTLQPGNYVALDTENGNPNKWPHTSFTVTAASSPAALPAARATVRAIEFGFKGPGTLHDGQVVRFENDGYLVHMIVGIPVKNAAVARKVTALLKAGKDGKAQKYAIGFVGFLGAASPGATQQFVLKQKPGVYVLACFMDTQDGREHTRLGMERTIRIVK